MLLVANCTSTHKEAGLVAALWTNRSVCVSDTDALPHLAPAEAQSTAPASHKHTTINSPLPLPVPLPVPKPPGEATYPSKIPKLPGVAPSVKPSHGNASPPHFCPTFHVPPCTSLLALYSLPFTSAPSRGCCGRSTPLRDARVRLALWGCSGGARALSYISRLNDDWLCRLRTKQVPEAWCRFHGVEGIVGLRG